MLTNDPARGSVRAVTDLAGVKGGKIARADVARFRCGAIDDGHLVQTDTRYFVVKGAENPCLICGFVAHQRRNDSL